MNRWMRHDVGGWNFRTESFLLVKGEEESYSNQRKLARAVTKGIQEQSRLDVSRRGVVD